MSGDVGEHAHHLLVPLPEVLLLELDLVHLGPCLDALSREAEVGAGEAREELWRVVLAEALEREIVGRRAEEGRERSRDVDDGEGKEMAEQGEMDARGG